MPYNAGIGICEQQFFVIVSIKGLSESEVPKTLEVLTKEQLSTSNSGNIWYQSSGVFTPCKAYAPYPISNNNTLGIKYKCTCTDQCAVFVIIRNNFEGCHVQMTLCEILAYW